MENPDRGQGPADAAPGHGRQDRPRRLRHRPVLAGLPAPVSRRQAQARSVLRLRHGNPERRPRHRRRRHRPRPSTRPRSDRGRRRNRRAAGPGAFARVRVRAGLLLFEARRQGARGGVAANRFPTPAGKRGHGSAGDGTRQPKSPARRPDAPAGGPACPGRSTCPRRRCSCWRWPASCPSSPASRLRASASSRAAILLLSAGDANGHAARRTRSVTAPAATTVPSAVKPTAYTFAVVHKHALGGCEGRLTVSGSGVAFVPAKAADRADDAFSFKYGQFVHTLSEDELAIKSRTRTYRFKAADGATRTKAGPASGRSPAACLAPRAPLRRPSNSFPTGR